MKMCANEKLCGISNKQQLMNEQSGSTQMLLEA